MTHPKKILWILTHTQTWNLSQPKTWQQTDRYSSVIPSVITYQSAAFPNYVSFKWVKYITKNWKQIWITPPTSLSNLNFSRNWPKSANNLECFSENTTDLSVFDCKTNETFRGFGSPTPFRFQLTFSYFIKEIKQKSASLYSSFCISIMNLLNPKRVTR